MRDSYAEFLDYFSLSEEEFLDYGINRTICGDKALARAEWKKLKSQVFGNKRIFVRGYGRNFAKTRFVFQMINEVFGNTHPKRDANGNSKPQRLIELLTGYDRTRWKDRPGQEALLNYQVSHVWGRTNNPLCFVSPWNVVLIPKLFDPFTNTDTKGQWAEKFQALLKKRVSEEFADLIGDYNEIITGLADRIDDHFSRVPDLADDHDLVRYKKDMIQQLCVVPMG